MKQLLDDPWQGIEAKYPIGAKLTGRVTNITDYGAFVELEPGIEGLIHVSEMRWTKKNVHPGKIVATSQEVEVQVLEVDSGQAPHLARPQADAAESVGEPSPRTHPVGSDGRGRGQEQDRVRPVHRPRRRRRRHGPPVRSRLEPPGEQVIEDFKKGDMVKAQVLDVDVEKERISLGIKQLGGDPFARSRARKAAVDLRKGQVVTCEIIDVKDGGIEVKIAGTDLTCFVKRSELARDRNDQRPDRFAVGEKVDARITHVRPQGAQDRSVGQGA